MGEFDEISYSKASKNTTQLAEMSKIFTSQFAPIESEGKVNDLWLKIADSPPVTDYLFRYDASKLVLENNAKVAAWADVSDNNVDLAQAVEANQPVYLSTGLNGRPSVQFDGLASYIANTALTLPDPDAFTAFYVLKFSDITAVTRMIMNLGVPGVDATPAQRYVLRKYSDNIIQQRLNASTSTQATIAAANVDTNPFLITGSFNKTVHKLYKNTTLSEMKEYTISIGELSAIYLGARMHSDLAEFFAGMMSEIIFFNRTLSDADIVKMQSYLMSKWGLA